MILEYHDAQLHNFTFVDVELHEVTLEHSSLDDDPGEGWAPQAPSMVLAKVFEGLGVCESFGFCSAIDDVKEVIAEIIESMLEESESEDDGLFPEFPIMAKVVLTNVSLGFAAIILGIELSKLVEHFGRSGSSQPFNSSSEGSATE